MTRKRGRGNGSPRRFVQHNRGYQERAKGKSATDIVRKSSKSPTSSYVMRKNNNPILTVSLIGNKLNCTLGRQRQQPHLSLR